MNEIAKLLQSIHFISRHVPNGNPVSGHRGSYKIKIPHFNGPRWVMGNPQTEIRSTSPPQEIKEVDENDTRDEGEVHQQQKQEEQFSSSS